MQTLSIPIKINAPKEKVWKVLWDDTTYRQWTGAFHEGSYAVSDWNEGSKILFLGPGGDGGMYSTIAKKIPNEFMSFKHLGEVKDGKEQPTSEWSGAFENYTLKETAGVTELTVEIDVTDDFSNYFKDTFPKALEKVKSLAEE
ncbi:MAG TPA: SRPBCC domain-containing protein [Chitinophagales bacterium]|nr:SRPBCC domain-containing protein [Chitinophagales bacterium]